LRKKLKHCKHVYIRCPGQDNIYVCIYCGKRKQNTKKVKFTFKRWAE